MGDIGTRVRAGLVAGAYRPVIAALLLLAAVSLGGSAGWGQSDGSVTVITGGSPPATPDSGSTPGSSLPASPADGTSSPAGDGGSVTVIGAPVSPSGDPTPVTTSTGDSSSGTPDSSSGGSPVTTVTGDGTSTGTPTTTSDGSVTTVTGGTTDKPVSGGVVSVGGTTNSLIGGGGAAAPPDVVSPGQDQPKSPVGGATGEFRTSVDIEVPAYHGIEPQLTLAYGSNRGAEQMGVGWRIEGLSKIERASAHGGAPVFDASDVYMLDDSELVACAGTVGNASCYAGGTHTTRIESYRRITQNAGNTWTVTDRDGTRYDYFPLSVWSGTTGNLATQYRWLLRSVTDTHYNTVLYSYACGEGVPDCYANTISYNGNVITFYWEPRPDPVTYAAGADIGQWTKRLNSVGVTVGSARLRIYNVSYAVTGTGRSAVTAIQEYGRDAVVQADGTVTGGTALPANQYRYQPVTAGFAKTVWSAPINLPGEQGDFNGDGRPDFAWVGGCNVTVMLSTGSAFAQQTWPINNCFGDAGTQAIYRAGDFNGDGKADIAIFRGAAVDGSGSWSANVLISGGNSAAGFTNASWGIYSTTIDNGLEFKVADFDGDGRQDLAVQSRSSLSPSGNRGCPAIYMSTGSSFQVRQTSLINIWPGCRARVEILDFNGDGKSDLVAFDNLNYNSNTNNPTAWVTITALRSTGTSFVASGGGSVSIPCASCTQYRKPSEPKWIRADINGDGKSDLVGIYGMQTLDDPVAGTWGDPQGLTILPLLSTGNGFVAQGGGGGGGFGGTRDAAATGSWLTGDFNGDGCEDLVVSEPAYHVGQPTAAPPQIEIYLSNGGGVQTIDMKGWKEGAAIGDFAGEGKDAIVWRESTNPLWLPSQPAPLVLFKSNGAAPDLMTGITASMGATTAIGYTTSDNWANTNLPFIMQTASRLVVNDGRGNVSTTTVSYNGGLWDAGERRFLGFKQANVSLPCNVGESACPTRLNIYLLSRAAEGLTSDVQLRDGAGVLQSWRHDEYTVNDTQLPYSALNTWSWVTQDNSGNYAKDLRTFDLFGNVTQLIQLGDTAVASDDVTTATDYVYNMDSYIVTTPGRVQIFAGSTSTGTLLGFSRFSYDGTTVWTPPTKGDVTLREDWLNTSGFLPTSFAYDGRGNTVTSTDPMGDVTRWVYDASGTFVIETRDPLFPSDPDHSTTTTWDTVCGLPSQTQDMNGLNTVYSYDALCRETNVVFPDGGFKQTAYVGFGNPASQYIQTLTPAVDGTGGLWERSYLDGLGRSYQDSKRGPAAGQDIITDTSYSRRGGTVASRSFPYYSGDPARISTYLYDALDRPVRLTHPDGSLVRKVYGAADTFSNATVTDELGRNTVTHYDAYGRVLRTDRTLAGATVSTRYSYDLLGHMTGIQDAAGNHWTYTYDSFGRKLTADDPDLGMWRYQYDNADRLIQTTDAKSQATHYTYDPLGRTLTKVTRYNTAQAVTTTYDYDQTTWGYNVGHLTRVTIPGMNYSYNYDAVGRMIGKDLVADGVSYNLLPTYDTGGRLRRIRYNTGYFTSGAPSVDVYTGTATNQWAYDTAGRLKSIPGVQTAATYTADGQPDSVTRANGTTTDYIYQPARLWLTGMKTTNAAGAVLQNFAYARDARGRITGSGSNIGYENWTYRYDDFDRLLMADNAIDDTLDQGFAYDTVGNMTAN